MEGVLEEVERIIRAEHERVEKALVVRADEERTLHRSQVLEPIDFKSHEDAAEEVEALVDRECERYEERAVGENALQFGNIFARASDYCCPGKCTSEILLFG